MYNTHTQLVVLVLNLVGKYDLLLHCSSGSIGREHMNSMKNISQGIIADKRKLFFKMFCFINPHNVPTDSIEAAFMYEQVNKYTLYDGTCTL